ncbi:hypothetical protein A5647_09755 [Mycobacterium sp. 1100029.7]|nr:hypothetical protein A5647_09755 [Mycobacterium sp. 1100029.7]
MRVLLAAPAAAVLALLGSVPATGAAHADPGVGATNPAAPAYSPPFVDHTTWKQWGDLSSLQVFPTPSGRLASRQPGTALDADEAWTEVLAMAPDAGSPGMRNQFLCHWQFAELAQPGKTSWNLEPWRPVVDDAEMVASGCNPGGPEEPQ